ncbi:MAG: Blue-light-activated protein [Candidatus Heimdallarchaeota archaeon LC_2]|nr:MAG: Blue-light-activated protein [Candidatus Heimdallarchaeota archaeon LC_2]
MEERYSKSSRNKKISSRIPVILAIIILIFSSSIWFFDYIDGREQVRQDTKIISDVSTTDIELKIVERIDLINSIMMTEWISTANITHLFNYDRFLAIVPGFFSYYDSYLAINYINTSDVISWVYPFESNQGALNRSITTLADGSINDAYIEARDTKQVRITPVISLFQGVKGLASYLPIIFENQLVGLFNVVFQIDTLVDVVLDAFHNQNYNYHLLENNIQFYEHGTKFSHTDSFVLETKIVFYNSVWVLHTRPNLDLRFQGSIYNNIEILFFGILASIVSFAFSRFIVNQNKLLEENFKKKEEIEKIMFQYQKMDDLGILAGGIAHDFNNLLMGLQANFSILTDIQLELLLNSSSIDKTVTQEMKETSLSIQELLERSVNLTSQILSFSRQSVIDLEFINMKTAIENTLRIITQSSDKRIVITKTLEKEPMFIYGNTSKISQLIMNVILNSIEAQPNGGTLDIDMRISNINSYHIQLGELDRSIGYDLEKMIVLQIRDSGSGIAKEDLDKLFVPFFTTKTKSKKGTGLGLAIAYRSVRTMFGDITIDSVQAEGTTVNIFLPLITKNYLIEKNIKFTQISNEGISEFDIKLSDKIKDSETGKLDEMKETEETRPKIMIVDDETAIRRGLRIYLKDKNQAISEFENGIDAIKFYEENENFDLVILDVNLPGMSGIQVQEKIREITPNQKILFITGYSEDSISVDPNSNIYILLKPFTKESFLSKIGEILSPEGLH